MKRLKAKLLQVPAGSATLSHHEAQALRDLVHGLQTLFDLWAYIPVHTPLVDYAAPYHGLLTETDQEQVYHLVGRDGAVLMLRSDITLFLVKQLSGAIRSTEQNLRYSYADSILRHQEDEDIGKNESFQAGIELIGPQGPEGDLEVLLLLGESLAVAGLGHAAIHLGSRRVFELACETLGIDADTAPQAASAIRLRDFATLDEVLTQAGLSPQHRTALLDLFGLICPATEASTRLEALGRRLPPPVAEELARLASLAAGVQELQPEVNWRLDPSELGSQNYHSGIVFQAYAPGMDAAFAMGGRYDRLLAALGSPRPAVGFSLMLSKILAARPLDLPGVSTSPLVAAGATFAERYQSAQKLRAAGKKVSL